MNVDFDPLPYLPPELGVHWWLLNYPVVKVRCVACGKPAAVLYAGGRLRRRNHCASHVDLDGVDFRAPLRRAGQHGRTEWITAPAVPPRTS